MATVRGAHLHGFIERVESMLSTCSDAPPSSYLQHRSSLHSAVKRAKLRDPEVTGGGVRSQTHTCVEYGDEGSRSWLERRRAAPLPQGVAPWPESTTSCSCAGSTGTGIKVAARKVAGATSNSGDDGTAPRLCHQPYRVTSAAVRRQGLWGIGSSHSSAVSLDRICQGNQESFLVHFPRNHFIG